jgi:Protein of unknown function (DUF3604)
MKYRGLTTAAVIAALTIGAGLPLAQGQNAPPGNAGIAYHAQREAYYGDLHLHTSYSFDAYILFGAKVEPEDAYRFARGESVSYLGDQIHRSTPPLDFLAVTDHSENIGVFNTLEDPNSALSKSEIGQEVRQKGVKVFGKIVSLQTNGKPLPGVDTKATAASAWQREIEAANHNYQPGKFTSFIAYEWTSMPDGQNLHRNVIFRGAAAPNPFTSVDSNKPEDLWAFLANIRKQGVEALAIPHNSNASNGLMFDWVDSAGRPIDQAYAEARAANEPLAEISQNKGASETVPALSPNDEFANFEFYDHLLVSQAKSKPGGSYVRDALGRGLEIATRTQGVNPYKYGIVGASDFHNGLSDSAESAFVGTFGAVDPSKKLPDLEAYKQRFLDLRQSMADVAAAAPTKSATPDAAPSQAAASKVSFDLYENGSGNLTGVWAEQNTRESIYDALRRKETFATSGTRLKFRFFGGWRFDKSALQGADWVQKAYARGVPMGGDLPAKPTHAKAPAFVLWSVKDPDGANLDRLQVVKVWLKDGKHVERLFDVALSNARKVDPKTGKAPGVGNTVDLKTATYANTIGATKLATVWRDPQFDPKVPAVYYLRVLEIPTPRWSTIVAVKRGTPLPSEVPATIQERGWSSPIWYTPVATGPSTATVSHARDQSTQVARR